MSEPAEEVDEPRYVEEAAAEEAAAIAAGCLERVRARPVEGRLPRPSEPR